MQKKKPQTKDISTLDLFIVPLALVIKCSNAVKEMYPDDPNNSFQTVLETGQELEDAGLTPIYLCDKGMKEIYVTSEEKIHKKLN